MNNPKRTSILTKVIILQDVSFTNTKLITDFKVILESALLAQIDMESELSIIKDSVDIIAEIFISFIIGLCNIIVCQHSYISLCDEQKFLSIVDIFISQRYPNSKLDVLFTLDSLVNQKK